MRQLFVPACLCLMTLSGPAGLEPKLSLEKFTGGESTGKKADAKKANPSEPSASDSLDAAIEIPENSLAGVPVPLPPIVKPVVHRSHEEVCGTLAESAQANNLPLPFFIRLLFQESRFQPEVVSAAGAEGVAQFMPETSADRGLANPYDPVQAIPASARLLRDLKAQFGNYGLAAAAYNAGPKRIQDWLAKRGKLPQETQGYVKTITGRPAENWKAAAAVSPDMKLPRRAPCQEAVGLYAWNGPDRIPMPAPSPLARAAAAVKVAMNAVAPAKARAATAAAMAEPETDNGQTADVEVTNAIEKRADAKTANAKVQKPPHPVAAPIRVTTHTVANVPTKVASAPIKVASVPAKPRVSVVMAVAKPAAAKVEKPVVAASTTPKGAIQLAARKVSKPIVADRQKTQPKAPVKTAGKPLELADAAGQK